MFTRRAVKAIAVSTAVLAVGLSMLAFTGSAQAATGPGASGNTITDAAQAQAPFTSGSFDSGQPIDVVVPPNSVLNPGATIFILECAAPNGVPPTSTAACDGNTAYAGGTISVNSDGSIDVINTSTNSGFPYVIYALPDLQNLGESANSVPKCGLGAANECVLYIGQGGGNDIGFAQPHFFSQAFQVHTDPTDSGSLNPGDGTADTGVAPAITSANSASFTQGTSGSFTVTATGTPSPTLSESGSLPAGVTFNATTGVLSGNSSVSGTFPITFTASNGVTPNATQSFTLHVASSGVAPAITSANSASFTEGTSGSFTVTATGTPSPTLSESGSLPAGVTFNATTGVLSGNSSVSGTFPITFTASNGVGTPASQNFTLTVNGAGPFQITTTSLPDAVVGTSYSQQLTDSGAGSGTVVWKKASLPNGFTLSPSGLLTGTPSAKATGPFNVGVSARLNKDTPVTATIPLTVDEAPVFNAKIPTATSFNEGTSSSFTIESTGYPTPSISETGSLPAGISFDDGVFSGTPTVTTNSGTFPFTITASNGVSPAATEDFTLTVYAPVVITTTSIPSATQGVPYSVTLGVTGGIAPYTWKKGGTLPKGLTLSSGGVLSGTVSTKVLPGDYQVPVTVGVKEGKVKVSQATTFTLHVVAPPA